MITVFLDIGTVDSSKNDPSIQTEQNFRPKYFVITSKGDLSRIFKVSSLLIVYER